MKKALTVLLILALTTACKAEDSKQVVELKKRCEELTKETGETYLYGSGELKEFAPTAQLTETTPSRDNPFTYWAEFIMPDKKRMIFTIRGAWDNPNGVPYKLKLAPLPIKMETGENYHFCYRIIKGFSEERFYIHYPETIQLIKE